MKHVFSSGDAKGSVQRVMLYWLNAWAGEFLAKRGAEAYPLRSRASIARVELRSVQTKSEFRRRPPVVLNNCCPRTF